MNLCRGVFVLSFVFVLCSFVSELICFCLSCFDVPCQFHFLYFRFARE